MTKIVRDYITDKIIDATQPQLNKLQDKVAATHREVDRGKLSDMIAGMKEFKALSAALKKAMYDKFGVTLTSLDPPGYYSVNWNVPENDKAVKAVEDFTAMRSRVIRDALVDVELAKSKADVDAAIAKAVAEISKAK